MEGSGVRLPVLCVPAGVERPRAVGMRPRTRAPSCEADPALARAARLLRVRLLFGRVDAREAVGAAEANGVGAACGSVGGAAVAALCVGDDGLGAALVGPLVCWTSVGRARADRLREVISVRAHGRLAHRHAAGALPTAALWAARLSL